MGCNSAKTSSRATEEQQPSDSSPDDFGRAMTEEEKEDEEEREKIKRNNNKKRENICAISCNEDQIKNYKPPSFPKSDASQRKIADTLRGNAKMKVLGVDKLSDSHLSEMVMAFAQKRVKQNQDVIVQGEAGDCLYVVEDGEFDILIGRKAEDGKIGAAAKVATFGPGSLFGELAILYNSPRAATVRCASSDGLIWSLDREPFQMLLKKVGVEKVEQYSGWLTQVEILKALNLHEISQLADACESVLLEKDEEVIRQGEAGDAFFILEEGQCAAFVAIEGQEKLLKTYDKQGEYFGELALINNAPRKATVRAMSDAVVLKVEKESFDNLLGPIIDRLKGQANNYPQYKELLK